MIYPPGHTHFVTSPCGAVSVTRAPGGWFLWIYGYMVPEPFANEVQAVIRLQKLTRAEKATTPQNNC